MRMRRGSLLIASVLCVCGIAAFHTSVRAGVDLPRWKVVSSKRGEIPQPGRISIQPGVVVADLRNEGTNAIVLASRMKSPALQAYYRAASNQWQQVVLDKNPLPLDCGGVSWDIDGDGYSDLVFGGDATSRQIWWWRNPGPKAGSSVGWERRLIKDGGATKHQGMAFGSFLADGKTQLAYWNQGARTMFLASTPDKPANASAWPTQPIFQPSLEEVGTNGLPTSIEAADIDGDGSPDILSGNRWFKYQGAAGFKPTVIGDPAARSIAGTFKDTRTPQVVTAPGETPGPLRIYECRGLPDVSTNWIGRDLITNALQHIDTLQAADINGDGFLDIFCAETVKWEDKPEPAASRRTKPKAWILYGDGQGNFLVTELASNQEMHESKAADLDGDGDVDIVSKPFILGAPGLEAWLNISAPQKVAGYGPSFRGPLGVQLSSVRREMGQNAPGALARLKQIGLRAVSMSGHGAVKPELLHREIQRISLRLGGLHIPYARLKDDFQGAIAEAKVLKPSLVICQDIPHSGPMGETLARTVLADFKVWSQSLKLEGIELAYQVPPEAFEEGSQGSFIQRLAAGTNPSELSFELDAATLAHAGLNLGQILESFPKRIASLVLADIAKTTINNPQAPPLSPEDVVPLGAGSLDWPALLGSARKSGVRGYWLRDESLFPYETLPKSLGFLETVKF